MPVCGGHLELGQQCQPVAVQRALRRWNPSRPRYQPLPSSTSSWFSPGCTQIGDVVGLVAQPVLVRGPARGQHLVADPPAVELGLVDAVRGGVEPGPHDAVGQRQRGRPATGAGASRPPISTGLTKRAVQSPASEQPGLHAAGSLHALQSPPPRTRTGPSPCSRRQRLGRPRHQDLLAGLDGHRLVRSDLDLVRGLLEAGVRVRHLHERRGPADPDAERRGRARSGRRWVRQNT